MFKKVLDYAGEYRRLTYRSVAVLLLGVTMSVLPFWFAYQLILPLLGYGALWSFPLAILLNPVARDVIFT